MASDARPLGLPLRLRGGEDPAPRPIDAHCHLHHPAFDSDREAVLARAREALGGLIVSACSPSEVEPVLALRRAHPGFVHAALGLHPSELLRITDAAIEEHMARLRDLRGEMVAVGEIGFDYKWIREPAAQRRMAEVADRFLDLAKELRLPAVLHMRNAPEEDYRRILGAGVPCQFHCWTASRALAIEAASGGHLVSIAPNVAKFKNPKRAAASVPLESLVVETDAPFFGLGERTEPSQAGEVCRAVAELRGDDASRVARATSENAARFFKL